MSTRVEKSVMVNVPVSRAYNQWTQFEDFPQFMGGVKSVTQLDDARLAWVAEIAGVRRQWQARIVEQVPDQKIAWAATEGATNAGAVTFEDLGGDQTRVTLALDYEPEGLVEKVGDSLNIVERQAEGDLERFKAFIEAEGYASGAWRGSVGTPGAAGTPSVEDAAASQGDSGKAGRVREGGRCRSGRRRRRGRCGRCFQEQLATGGLHQRRHYRRAGGSCFPCGSCRERAAHAHRRRDRRGFGCGTFEGRH